MADSTKVETTQVAEKSTEVHKPDASTEKAQPWKAYLAAQQAARQNSDTQPWDDWKPASKESVSKPWSEWIKQNYDPNELPGKDPSFCYFSGRTDMEGG